MKSSPRLVVLCGAGASYDCAPEGADIRTEFRPPLVQSLFEPRFGNILSGFPKAQAISEEIRTVATTSQSLEEVLAKFAQKGSIRRRRQYRQVPLYLRQVMGECGAQFLKHGATNYDTLIGQVEDSSFAHVAYVTVNYDVLLDLAVAGLYWYSPITELGQYVVPERAWQIYKLHGSINWGVALHNVGDHQAGTLAALDSVDTLDFDFETVRVLQGFHLKHLAAEGRTFYPWLSVPERSKEGFSCPNSHLDSLRQDLQECTAVLLIGYSGLDEHVNEMLYDTPQLRSVFVVAGSVQAASEVRSRMGPLSGRMGLYDGGFSQFLRSGVAGDWLRQNAN